MEGTYSKYSLSKIFDLYKNQNNLFLWMDSQYFYDHLKMKNSCFYTDIAYFFPLFLDKGNEGCFPKSSRKIVLGNAKPRQGELQS